MSVQFVTRGSRRSPMLYAVDWAEVRSADSGPRSFAFSTCRSGRLSREDREPPAGPRSCCAPTSRAARTAGRGQDRAHRGRDRCQEPHGPRGGAGRRPLRHARGRTTRRPPLAEWACSSRRDPGPTKLQRVFVLPSACAAGDPMDRPGARRRRARGRREENGCASARVEVLRSERERVVIGAGLAPGERVSYRRCRVGGRHDGAGPRCLRLQQAVAGAARVARASRRRRATGALVKRAIAWFAQNHVAANLLMLLLVVQAAWSRSPASSRRPSPTSTSTWSDRCALPRRRARGGGGGRLRPDRGGDPGHQGASRAELHGGRGPVCVSARAAVTGYPVDRALSEIKNAVDAITTFPKRPRSRSSATIAIRRNALQLALSGDARRAPRSSSRRARCATTSRRCPASPRSRSPRALRDLHRGARGGAAPPRHHLRRQVVRRRAPRARSTGPGGSIKTDRRARCCCAPRGRRTSDARSSSEARGADAPPTARGCARRGGQRWWTASWRDDRNAPASTDEPAVMIQVYPGR